MHRTRVLLLLGGESAEHEVSITSARNVYAALDDRKYDITLGYITKDGHWHLVEDIEILEGRHPSLVPVLGGRHFLVEPGGKHVVPEVILPILHGPNGEDGTVQGLAQLLHIPIAGAGLLSSVLCMDKEVAKRLLSAASIPVADYIVHRAHEPALHFSHMTLQLGNPVFVKPANLGSSLGITKVYDEAGFIKACQEAHRYDTKILIEQAISGRELECSVLGNEDPQASVVGEVKPKEEFYNYSAKYNPASQTEVIVPADIAEETAEKVRNMALSAYRTLECRGLARVDFFLAANGSIYVNELNTMPGFTNTSVYPKLWRASGLSYTALIDKVIQLALQSK